MIDNLYSSDKYALFELELPEGGDGTTAEVAEVVLEFLDPESGERISRAATLNIAFTGDSAEVEKSRNPEIVSQAAMARNAEIREEAVRLADEGKAKEAARILGERKLQLMTIAPAAGEAAPAMMRESEVFDELADSLSSSGELSNEKRKEMLNEAYILKNQQTRVEEVDEVDDDEAASDDYAESPEDE